MVRQLCLSKSRLTFRVHVDQRLKSSNPQIIPQGPYQLMTRLLLDQKNQLTVEVIMVSLKMIRAPKTRTTSILKMTSPTLQSSIRVVVVRNRRKALLLGIRSTCLRESIRILKRKPSNVKLLQRPEQGAILSIFRLYYTSLSQHSSKHQTSKTISTVGSHLQLGNRSIYPTTG